MCLAADVLLSWMAERKVINAEVGEGEEDERLGRCDIEAVELVPYDVPGLFSHNDCLSDCMNVANLIFFDVFGWILTWPRRAQSYLSTPLPSLRGRRTAFRPL